MCLMERSTNVSLYVLRAKPTFSQLVSDITYFIFQCPWNAACLVTFGSMAFTASIWKVRACFGLESASYTVILKSLHVRCFSAGLTLVSIQMAHPPSFPGCEFKA